jgi:hypothetical protein
LAQRRLYVDVPPAGVRILNITPLSGTPAQPPNKPFWPFQKPSLLTSDGVGDGSFVNDWDPHHYKATCGNRFAMTGLSLKLSDRRLNRQLCQFAPSLGGQTAVVSGSTDSARVDRVFPNNTPILDWDFGNVKWQCGANEYVSGISQHPTTFAVHAIRCSKGLGQLGHCEVRKIGSSDNRGDTRSGDWSPGDLKAECSAGKVAVGLSHSPSTKKVSSLLCCDG